MKQPNIIIIMTDDQGYGDLSCMGNTDFITPNIDRLAASGARFSCMYSGSPVCSPSRAALLTGRYPGYAGVRSILAGHRQATGLTAQAPTIATAVGALGYDTGLVGKWHLGLRKECRPESNGFGYSYGFLAGCIDYYSHIFYWGMADGKTNPTHDLWENGEEIYENGRYFTELVTQKSVEFIRSRSGENPFLLYVGYNAPHYPMHAPQRYLDRFPHLPWDRQIMAAMLSAVDDGVGHILAELARQGELDNTIVYFQSDNGPSRESRNWLDGREDFYYGGRAGKFKGHKFSLFEGGIRVPGIISWPKGIPAGQVVDAPVAAMDLFPTLLGAAGGKAGDYRLNGVDLLPLLTGKAPLPPRRLFWEMGDQTAVRDGQYKLVLNGQLVEQDGPEQPVALYNLEQDPSERHNLALIQPQKCAALRQAAEEWRAGLEAHWQEVSGALCAEL